MAQRQETSGNRLDDAARAGWLYYVAGNNQEEIAQKQGVLAGVLAELRAKAVRYRETAAELDVDLDAQVEKPAQPA